MVDALPQEVIHLQLHNFSSFITCPVCTLNTFHLCFVDCVIHDLSMTNVILLRLLPNLQQHLGHPSALPKNKIKRRPEIF